MRLRQLLAGAACVAAAVTFARCGGGGNSGAPPTTPGTLPTAAPTPTPTPGIVLPAGMVCDPTPPPILYFKPTRWRPHGNGWVMDSQPVVPNVDHYCARVGFGDWRYCETRLEDDPQRQACDYLMTGKANDTGRWGPTWSVDGMPCDGKHQCVNHEDNQFKAIAKDDGLFEACASPLVPVYPGGEFGDQGSRCGEVWVDVNK